MVDALRQSDLLMTHLVDPLALARGLGAAEHRLGSGRRGGVP
jgi:hypothetical protein